MPLHAPVPKREDGQVKRDENEDDDNAHDDEDGGLNQSQRRGQRGGTSSSKNSATELSICGKRAGLFADRDHLGREVGKDSGLLQASRRGFCLRARCRWT